MTAKRLTLLLTLVSLFLVRLSTNAQGTTPDPAKFQWVKVAGDLENPVGMTAPKDGSGRLFVTEQAGLIWIIKDGQRLEPAFLDLTDVVEDEVTRGGYSERGLLGLAFHPDYKNNGIFFVYY